MDYNLLFYSIIGFGSIIGVFKSADWLISTKYRTKEMCENCRNKIYEIINDDRALLVRLDAKMDIVLEKIKDDKKD